MSYELGEPEHGYRCTLLGIDGHVCGRTLGPYYDRRLLIDAVARHRAAQHVKALSKMEDREPGDARIKAALSKNPTYEPPAHYHGHR